MFFEKIADYLSNSVKDVFIRPKYNVASLDGLRAMAIILVFAVHLKELLEKTFHISPALYSIPPFKGGWIGVPLFFVLSGYLIGGQLWKELEKTNSINFGRFILRRGFRIWPLYYAVVFAIFLLSLVHLVPGVSYHGFLSNLFFLSNFWEDTGPISGAAWSLATEEHFYILAPLLMILTLRFKKSASLSFYRKLLYLSFFLPLLNRILVWDYIYQIKEFDLSIFMNIIYRPILTNSEGLIVGMIISNIVNDRSFSMPSWLRRRTLLLMISIPFAILSFKDKVYSNFSFIAITFGLLLWVCLDSENRISRFFAHPIFFPISKTSFSIYLINKHVIGAILGTHWFHILQSYLTPSLTLLVGFIITLSASFFVGMICFVLIEKPFLEFRKKIMS